MRALVHERLHYEIAMSIGNSLDIGAMLRESLSTYLRKLNCLAGAVLRRVDEDCSSFEMVYAIPKRIQRNSVLKVALEEVPSGLTKETCERFLADLPSSRIIGEYSHYLMELPGFGLLLLVKSAPGLSTPDIKSLAPINAKLADACQSCVVNELLQDEIRERKKAEELYRAIVDNALDGIYQSTLDGKYLHVNPALAHTFGYETAEELVEKVNNVGVMHYVNPEERARFLDILKRDGQVHGFEFEFRRTDGSVGWMSTSARLEKDGAGNALYVEGTCKEITQQKHAEAALREAKAEAERLSQMKSNLISTVSHELRTPLTSILGFAKIIRRRLEEVSRLDGDMMDKVIRSLSRMGENAQVIISEGERLTELINNVLDLAKLEAGHYVWNMETISIGEVLKRSLASTEVLFRGSGVALVSDVPQGLPHVMADHDRLIQVTINLLSNAAKFTVQGEVKVSAAVESGEVVVRVSDTGVGIPADEVGAIFETFRQLGNTLTDKPKGTGLGLPICKEIVEHHGGRIWVETEIGKGSVFAYSVPVK